jgi:hypothetical protein
MRPAAHKRKVDVRQSGEPTPDLDNLAAIVAKPAWL